MRRLFKHYTWLFSIAWARAFGRAWLAPAHQALLSLSLHALGYDNCVGSNTGEAWFVRHILSRHPIKVCLDIGANVGDYSERLARELDGATIYAFEPAQGTFDALKRRFTGIPRIVPVRSAVTNHDGTAPLYLPAPGAETATLERSIFPDAAAEEVPVMSVDSFARSRAIDRIDFVKIDTEGFERETLEGMQESLLTLRPRLIQFEFNHLQLYRGYSLYDLSRLLPGYRLFRLLPRGFVAVDPRSSRDNVYRYANYVAVRDDLSL